MMKKLILMLLLIPLAVTAQEPVKKYCEVVGKGDPTKREVKIEQTIGDSEAYAAASCTTMIQAVNALAQKGWSLVEAYAVVETQGMKRDAYYHYIFSKPTEAPKTTK